MIATRPRSVRPFVLSKGRTLMWIGATAAVLLVGVLLERHAAAASAQAHALLGVAKSALAHGDGAEATLALERARLVAPRDADVRAALQAAGLPTWGSPGAAGAWNAWTGWLSTREWSAATTGWAWLAAVAFAVFIVRGRTAHFARRAAVASAAAFVLSAVGLVDSNLASRSLAVVTSESGALVAPYEGSAASAELRPGALVVLRGDRFGTYAHVQASASGDAVTGWVASTALRPVVGS